MNHDNKDQKISALYPMAWCLFLLVPAYAFYTSYRHHSMLGMVASSVAMAGFITLIVLALRHNRRLSRQGGSR